MIHLKLNCVDSILEVASESFSRYISDPLEVGQGTTIGSLLRRVMLTDLSGLSIIAVRIPGVEDQFSSLPGVREDLLEIILNLKGLIFKEALFNNLEELEETEIILTTTKLIGPCVLTGDMFYLKHEADKMSEVKMPNPFPHVINPNHYIATYVDKTPCEIEIKLTRGKTSALRKDPPLNSFSGYFQVDTTFMPVKAVAFEIQHLFSETLGPQEQLVLDVWTNGSLTPNEAINEASKIIVNCFIPLETDEFCFQNSQEVSSFGFSVNEENEENEKEEKKEEENLDFLEQSINFMPIEELELSVRAFNGLKKANIHFVGDLLKFSLSELKNIKNFGKTSLNEVINVLAKYNKVLKD